MTSSSFPLRSAVRLVPLLAPGVVDGLPEVSFADLKVASTPGFTGIGYALQIELKKLVNLGPVQTLNTVYNEFPFQD